MNVCAGCKHFIRSGVSGVAYCGSQKAARFDRVRGPVQPALTVPWAKDSSKITDKCDKEGWFEKRRPWWVF